MSFWTCIKEAAVALEQDHRLVGHAEGEADRRPKTLPDGSHLPRHDEPVAARSPHVGDRERPVVPLADDDVAVLGQHRVDRRHDVTGVHRLPEIRDNIVGANAGSLVGHLLRELVRAEALCGMALQSQAVLQLTHGTPSVPDDMTIGRHVADLAVPDSVDRPDRRIGNCRPPSSVYLFKLAPTASTRSASPHALSPRALTNKPAMPSVKGSSSRKSFAGNVVKITAPTRAAKRRTSSPASAAIARGRRG